MSLKLNVAGGPAAQLKFHLDGGVEVDVRIDCEESPPTWLGRFHRRRVAGAVRIGNRWYVPDVPAPDIEAALRATHGRQGARRLAHERIHGDARRLREYGRTWCLYRLTVEAARDGVPLGSETVAGLTERDLPPVGGMALIGRLAGELLASGH
ncbi:hypothetical protein [Methylomagnum sp.]